MEQKPKTPRERTENLIRLLVLDWRPTPEQVLWVIRIAIVLVVVLGILTFIGLPFGITLWEWLKVLAVPITVGAAVPLLNWLQKKRELEVENQSAQDTALQMYLDQMSQLLLDKDQPLRESKERDEVRTLAQARTLTVLSRLDGDYKRSVLQFLYEAGLLSKDAPLIRLAGADLRGADLRGADLRGASLKGVDLGNADLRKATLRGVDFSQFGRKDNRRKTNLRKADLRGANLRNADLTGAEGADNIRDRGAYLRDTIMANGQTVAESPLLRS
jgi:hypothetical protein